MIRNPRIPTLLPLSLLPSSRRKILPIFCRLFRDGLPLSSAAIASLLLVLELLPLAHPSLSLRLSPTASLSLRGVLLAADEEEGEETKEENESPEGEELPAERETEKREKALKKLKLDIRFAASEERRRSIKKVKKLKEGEREDFIPLLMELAEKDLDPLVRDSTIQALGDMNSRRAAPILEKSLEDDNPDVRRSAVRAIRKIDAKQSAPALEKMVRKEDFSENNLILSSALLTLGNFRYRTIAPFLVEKAKEGRTNYEMRRAILLYLGNARSTESYDYLLETATNENEDAALRAYAVNALGKIKNPEAAQPLHAILENLRTLKSKRERIRFNSLKLQLIVALIRLGDESVVPEILATARDDDPTVRLRAIRQLGNMKLEQARDLLEYKAEHDPSVRVRKAAQKSLRQIKGEEKTEEEEL